jgi:hypothetical protein
MERKITPGRINPLIVTLFLTVLYLLLTATLHAQNVAINTDGSKADPNAILDIKSSSKGLLIPRITTAQRMKIPQTTGLMVYDVTTKSFWYSDGESWKNMSEVAMTVTSEAWLITGNAGTVDGTHFLGTTDNVPLNIRVNNQKSGRIDPSLNNTFWGYKSGFMSPTGKNNTGVGESTLYHTTTGFDNTAVGSMALAGNTMGFSNSALGRFALAENRTGNYNTAVGQAALHFNSTGQENVAIGTGAGFGNGSSSYNTAVGVNSQFFHKGSENTSVGAYTLAYYDGGTGNTALGYWAMGNVEFGSMYNTAIGHSSRIWVGRTAADVAKFSTVLGYRAEARGSNATAIGNGALAEVSNKVRIGNAAVTVIEGQVPFTTPSDGRYKFNVKEDVKGLDFILALRPVTYQFDVKRFDGYSENGGLAIQANYDEAIQMRRSGFIAQEVEKAAQTCAYNFSGINKPKSEKDHYSLSYESFVVPLVKAVQQQQQIINDQNKKIGELQNEIAEIKKMLKASK